MAQAVIGVFFASRSRIGCFDFDLPTPVSNIYTYFYLGF